MLRKNNKTLKHDATVGYLCSLFLCNKP